MSSRNDLGVMARKIEKFGQMIAQKTKDIMTIFGQLDCQPGSFSEPPSQPFPGHQPNEQQDEQPDEQPAVFPFYPLDPTAGDIGSDADSDNEGDVSGRNIPGREELLRKKRAKQRQSGAMQSAGARVVSSNRYTDTATNQTNNSAWPGEADPSSRKKDIYARHGKDPLQNPSTTKRLRSNSQGRFSPTSASASSTPARLGPRIDPSKTNVAVMGVRMSGKSRLVKALLRLKAANPPNAESNPLESNESSSGLENCAFWELPAPANGVPFQTYLKSQNLKAYDLVLVVFSDTIKEFDGAVAECLHRKRIPFLVVRSKTDQAMEEGIDDGYEKEEIVGMIKQHSLGELAQFNVKNKRVLCVASTLSKQNSYDMPVLVQALREAASAAAASGSRVF